ncbi:MAG: right-handed parallel beta-helix repeat-containing protein [Phycisphaerales bacterium]|jgi:hypothetical protein|nr:right-handed parallel beta-helix repeat-containing protein [Phycisphaerales bacterium]
MLLRIACCSLLGLACQARAETLLVPEDHPTIQAGINAALDGDVVSVDAGVWLGWISFRGKDIVVESRHGAEATTIDGGEAPSAVVFTHGESQASVLSGFTVTGSGGGTEFETLRMGAGMYIHLASPTIEDCIIRDCSSQFGGGVSIWEGAPVFRNVVLRDNTATVDGGGMRIHYLSHPTMESCVLLNNTANVHGGGLAYGNDSNGVHDGCTFEGNVAGIRGGGLSKSCDCSNAVILNSTLCSNTPDHILGTWDDYGGNELCPLCAHDLNADGVVGVDDVLAVVGAWGGCVCVEDITGDAVVNIDDLLLVIDSWGACPA